MALTKIDQLTFRSPINKENSFTAWNVCKDTESTMELYFDKDTHGYIEWDIPEIEETVGIGLTFEFDEHGKRTLVDYDGVFDLGDQVFELLERNGVDCAEMRKTLADE